MKLIFGLNIFFFTNPIANAELCSRNKLPCMNYRVCKHVRFSDYVPTTASKCVRRLRPAGRRQSRRKTRASCRQDAGALEAGRGQCGRAVKLFLGGTV